VPHLLLANQLQTRGRFLAAPREEDLMSHATRLFFILLLVGSPSLALAGATNDPASIAFHITNRPAKAICASAPALTAAAVQPQLNDGSGCTTGAYTVWAIVCNGSDSLGVAGVGFGIQYGPNLLVDSWTRCGDLEFSQAGWPGPGTGNIITWAPGTNCQDTPSEPFAPGTVIAVAGAFNVTLYGPDQLAAIARPGAGNASVADCSAAETVVSGAFPSHLGIAGFCRPGYNPCNAPTPVRETSWGRIKSQY
jgi:hypothetical protein